MKDPRLTAIALEARGKGWGVRWEEEPCRSNLIVTPILNREDLEGMFKLGFGATLGRKEVICWVYECWDGTLIDPWVDRVIEIHEELQYFHVIGSLKDALPVFDRGCRRYMAHVRRLSLAHFPGLGISIFDDLDPLAEA
jgi:hypothetical protein